MFMRLNLWRRRRQLQRDLAIFKEKREALLAGESDPTYAPDELNAIATDIDHQLDELSLLVPGQITNLRFTRQDGRMG